VFRLLPQGVISGHILDEEGEPVQYAQIRVMRYRFVRGQRQMFSPGYGSTDDLGEYRVFGLAPGKYYLSATYRLRNTMMEVQDRNPRGAVDEGYAPTYFPGTNDAAGASVIDVSPGAVLTGVDVTLHKTRTVRVRGRVVNPLGECSATIRSLAATGLVVCRFISSSDCRAFRSRGSIPQTGRRNSWTS
jgi:hypothetical protein